MNKNKNLIWKYLFKKKDTYDNDYYFYEDGTILHSYDRTMMKINIEEYVLSLDISDLEKEKIMTKCKEEYSKDVVKQIKKILIAK